MWITVVHVRIAAIVNGLARRVRRGPVGLVAAATVQVDDFGLTIFPCWEFNKHGHMHVM